MTEVIICHWSMWESEERERWKWSMVKFTLVQWNSPRPLTTTRAWISIYWLFFTSIKMVTTNRRSSQQSWVQEFLSIPADQLAIISKRNSIHLSSLSCTKTLKNNISRDRTKAKLKVKSSSRMILKVFTITLLLQTLDIRSNILSFWLLNSPTVSSSCIIPNFWKIWL